MVLKWVTLCGQHFRQEVNELDFQIFFDSLNARCASPERTEEAFKACLNECLFMPKLAELWERMPYQYEGPPCEYRPELEEKSSYVSEKVEPYSNTHNLRTFTRTDGSSTVRLEPK